MRILGPAIALALALAAGSACAAAIQDEFNRVIDESRRTDVSVTPAQALLYHGLGLVLVATERNGGGVMGGDET